MKSRILAIGAHPDDVELGCGGLLQQAEASRIVLMTNGSAGGNPEVRLSEARKASTVLGAAFYALDFADTNIHLPQAICAIERQLSDFNPTMILTMSSNDTHQDHRIVYEATVAAARKTPCTILSYMGPSSIKRSKPSWFVPLNEKQMRKKLEAIRVHKTQGDKPYLSEEYVLNQARYWASISFLDYPYVEPYELIEHWEIS